MMLRSVLALLFAVPAFAMAQGWPVKPVRVIVPYAAGGAADTVARAMGQRLGEVLGQNIVIENRAGAGALIGSDHVAKSAPDGYTLLLTVGPPHGSYPLFMKSVPFDPVRDFTPVMIVGTAPQAIAVHPSVPANNVRELVEHAKNNPGKLSFGTSGTGSSQHMGGLLLNRIAGLDLVHVPYKGGAPALNDAIAGQIPVAIVVLSNILPHARAGKLKLLAVLEAQRAKAAPDTPTVAESGITGYALPDTWIGMVGPARLPEPIVGQLHAALGKAVAFPDVRQRMDAAGFEIRENTPAQFAELIARSYEVYRKITAEAGIQPE